MIEPLLDENELSEVTGQSVSTIQKDRLVGSGCPFIRIGRLIRYRPEDVRAYLASLPTFMSTSAATAAGSLQQHRRALTRREPAVTKSGFPESGS